MRVVRDMFNLRESHNAEAPESPIELFQSLSVVRVEFDLRESLNADAPDEPIEFLTRLSSVRVEFDLRESLNAHAPSLPIKLLEKSKYLIAFESTNCFFDLMASNTSSRVLQSIISISPQKSSQQDSLGSHDLRPSSSET